MSTKPQFRYFDIQHNDSGPSIDFAGLGEFLRFLDLHHSKNILRHRHPQNPALSYFAIALEGFLYRQAAHGYEQLEDYQTALAQGYPEATAYYEGSAWDCPSYADYLLVRDHGVKDPNILKAMNEGGFVTHFPAFEKLRLEQPTLPDTGPAESPHALYQFATDHGFDSYAGFEEAWLKGFIDADEYQVALAKGYEDYADYQAALEGGFLQKAEYEEARAQGIATRAAYSQYKNLEQTGDAAMAHDERLLYALITLQEQSRKISLNKLWAQLEEELIKYQSSEGDYPAWFRRSLPDMEAAAVFLANHPALKAFGNYDADGEYFEVNLFRDREVVVDASNVAFNSQGDRDGKTMAHVKNLLLVAENLRERGMEQVTFIADASLRYRLSDADQLPRLKKLVKYLEVPAQTTADEYLIQYVKDHRCKVISNDTFRDWKRTDPWAFLNLDFFRVPFIIDGKAVILKGLE